MRNYEVTFIVDPTLSNGEIKSTAKKYADLIANAGKIVYNNEIGLLQLAYSIKNRNTGIYSCIEFEVPNGEVVDKMELAMRRDEKILRFLSVKLDNYGVKYNEDKRAGKIGTIVRKKKVVEEDKSRDNRRRGNKRRNNNKNGAPKPPAQKTTKKPADSPVAKPAETTEK